MNFSKVRTVKSPNRGSSLSAGIDFFVPQKVSKQGEFIDKFDNEFLNDLIEKNKDLDTQGNISPDRIVLKPQQAVLIPSGIHVNLNEVIPQPISFTYNDETKPDVNWGVMLTAHNKSGVGTKKNLDRLAEVVDQDYQGELHISVINAGNKTQIINPGDKLIQFILEFVILSNPNEVPIDELYTAESERGAGGFGSTGDK